MSQFHVEQNCNSSNVHSEDHVEDAYTSAKLLASLSLPELRIRHHDIRAHRVEGVGDWLLQAKDYQNWFKDISYGELDNSVLFCHGDPGVGKTYISSLVIDKLCDWARGQDTVVAFFYFDYAAQKDQSPMEVLSSLLKQIVGGLEEIPANIARALRRQEKVFGAWKLGLRNIADMLQDISSSRPTFICIDALDECMPEYRAKLLDSLKQILRKSPSTKIFLTGSLHIRYEVEKHLAGNVVAISITPAKEDTIRFLRAKIKQEITLDAPDMSLEEDVVEDIIQAIPEIFLLASLNIKVILQETALHQKKDKIGTMTARLSLADAYDAIIEEIKAQQEDKARLGMTALMWISHSERPLNVDEICHALAVELGSVDIKTDNVPSIYSVLDCCQGLAIVGEESSTIRLIHFTLKRYLCDHAHLFSRAHSKMAETCLTYLNFQKIKNFDAGFFPITWGIPPFLEYSSLYWGTHMRIELSDRARSLALDLLSGYDNHISAKYLEESTFDRFFYSPMPPSVLHCVSYFGISEIAIDLIRAKGWDVNERDSAGLTLLMWAAKYGREEIVKVLLQHRHIQPNMRDTLYGRTALSWGAGSGHEGVVRLFLSRTFVDPGNIGRWWGKIFEVTSLLFGGKYVDPDRLDRSGQTPLMWAARTGHDGVVKLLLGRGDVNPNRRDNYKRTPLSLAAQNGHDGVVELLLGEEDISPSQPDNYSRTPLALAARSGHDRTVKLLLQHEDVNPHTPDNDGQTPLAGAARHGYRKVVKLLLRRGNFSLEKPNNLGQTPLSLAARNKHDGIVKLLSEQGNVSPNKPENRDKSPLTLDKEKKSQPEPRCSRSRVINLPALTLQRLQGFTPHEVVEWLDNIGYFEEFGSPDQAAIFRESFTHNSLSGIVLLENGYDLRLLLRFLPFGPAFNLAELVRGLYQAAVAKQFVNGEHSAIEMKNYADALTGEDVEV